MKNLLLLSLLFIGTALIAQTVKTSEDFSIDISKPYPVVDGTKKWYFTHEDKILAIKMHGDFTFQLFDANSMDQKSISSISKKNDLPRGFVHEEFLQSGSRIFQFYNVWDKPNKTEQIFYKELGFDGANKTAEGKLLFKYNGYLKSRMGQNKIDLYQSFDKTKTLMVYEHKKTETKDKLNFQTFGMLAFDQDMNELWRKEIKMPYSEAEMVNMGYTLDNKGNAYLLIRKKKEDEKTPLELMKINGGDVVKKIDLSAGGKFFPRGVKLQEGKDNKIFCAGYYGGSVASQGIYVSVLNENGDVENEKFHEIPLEIINQNKSDKAQEKAEKREEEGVDVGVDHLSLDAIAVNPDGSLILIGEVFWVMTIPGLNSATNHFNYKEMMIVKTDSNGDLVWMKKMVKNQKRRVEYNGSYGMGTVAARLAANKETNLDLSYSYFKSKTDHYFLYIDNLKNLNLPENQYPAQHVSGLGGYLTAYRVNDQSGEVTKLSLFNLKDLKGIPVYQFNIDRIVHRSDNEMFLELYKKKKEDIMLRIVINE